MLQATIEILVTTSTNKTFVPDPWNFWTVRLTTKQDDQIVNCVEQDFLKSEFDKTNAANQMIENQITTFYLIL